MKKIIFVLAGLSASINKLSDVPPAYQAAVQEGPKISEDVFEKILDFAPPGTIYNLSLVKKSFSGWAHESLLRRFARPSSNDPNQLVPDTAKLLPLLDRDPSLAYLKKIFAKEYFHLGSLFSKSQRPVIEEVLHLGTLEEDYIIPALPYFSKKYNCVLDARYFGTIVSKKTFDDVHSEILKFSEIFPEEADSLFAVPLILNKNIELLNNFAKLVSDGIKPEVQLLRSVLLDGLSGAALGKEARKLKSVSFSILLLLGSRNLNSAVLTISSFVDVTVTDDDFIMFLKLSKNIGDQTSIYADILEKNDKYVVMSGILRGNFDANPSFLSNPMERAFYLRSCIFSENNFAMFCALPKEKQEKIFLDSLEQSYGLALNFYHHVFALQEQGKYDGEMFICFIQNKLADIILSRHGLEHRVYHRLNNPRCKNGEEKIVVKGVKVFMAGLRQDSDFGSTRHTSLAIKCLENISSHASLIWFLDGIELLSSNPALLKSFRHLVLQGPEVYIRPDIRHIFSWITSLRLQSLLPENTRDLLSIVTSYISEFFTDNQIEGRCSEAYFGEIIYACIHSYKHTGRYFEILSKDRSIVLELVLMIAINFSVDPRLLNWVYDRLMNNNYSLNNVIYSLQKDESLEKYLNPIFSRPDYQLSLHARALVMIKSRPLGDFVDMIKREKIPLDKVDQLVLALIKERIEEGMLREVLTIFSDARLDETVLQKAAEYELVSDEFIFWLISNFYSRLEIEVISLILEKSLLERDFELIIEHALHK